MVYKQDKLSEMDKEVVNLMEKLTIMGVRAMLRLEGDLPTLIRFLRKILS